MFLPKYIFCRCIKPYPICVNKKNTYKIDIRDLINTYNLSPYLSKSHLEYDFINQRPLYNKFECRFKDSNTNSNNNVNKDNKKS